MCTLNTHSRRDPRKIQFPISEIQFPISKRTNPKGWLPARHQWLSKNHTSHHFMDTRLPTLELLERSIDERKNLEQCLQSLRSISKRVEELTDRILALYSFPDLPDEPVSKQSFIWPKTAILPSAKALSGNYFDYEKGVLSFLGYRVGYSGISLKNRRAVLSYAYHERLPSVVSTEYMAEWSEPETAVRLKKIADSLAAFARNGRRNEKQDMSEAVNHWVTDLAWLKTEYYDGHYDSKFAWPNQK
jgi:hypothetical protein